MSVDVFSKGLSNGLSSEGIERVIEMIKEERERIMRCASTGHVGGYETGVNYTRWEMGMYCPRCGANYSRGLTHEEVEEETRRFNTPMRI